MDFVGLGFYAHPPEGNPTYPHHYEQQQLPSIPNREKYVENSRQSGVDFVPETGTNTESSFHPTESAAAPGLPPLPVGVSKPSGPMPAYLQHSQMLPSFPTPLQQDGPPRTVIIPQTDDSNSNATQQQQIEEGRNKALAILKQFGAVKQMEEEKLQKEAEIGRKKVLAILEDQKLHSLSSKDGHLLSLNALPPEEWARRRRACFEALQQKHQSALFRNFEYVARVGEERLKAQEKKLQDTERHHSEMEAYHAQAMKDRAKAYAAVRNKDYSFTVAGIGTQQRQKSERKRKRNQGQDASSVAIYVSNLPKDGSASEELMRALFGSYGNLRKIHFYMNKQTGELKGDALVIYNDDRSQAEVNSSIVEAVCSQVRARTVCLDRLDVLHVKYFWTLFVFCCHRLIVFCYASRCLVPLMMELFALFFCRYCEATFGLCVCACALLLLVSNFETHDNKQLSKKMNGAELASGTCIKVEPADPMHQLRKKKEAPNYYGNGGTTQQISTPVEVLPKEEGSKERSTMGAKVDEGTSKQENGGGDEDDLDDFFASLS